MSIKAINGELIQIDEAEFAQLKRQARSPRSLNTKLIAHYRADVVWQDQDGKHAAWLDQTNTDSPHIITGGSELAKLIAKADSYLAAMRKIVQ